MLLREASQIVRTAYSAALRAGVAEAFWPSKAGWTAILGEEPLPPGIFPVDDLHNTPL